MKICIDARCLMEGRRTGVEEYILGLLEELFVLDKENEYILFLNSWKEPNFDFSVFSKFPNVRIKRLRVPNKLLNLCFWYLDWPKIDKIVGGANVVFLPNIAFGSVSRKAKLILTVHDLSFERYPEKFSLKRRLWHIFINPKKICRLSDRIIAVSDSTKNDLAGLYGIKKEKIETIHSAASEKFRVIDRNDPAMVAVKEKYSLPYKFILFLGTIEPRKNIAGLVRAYDAFRKFIESRKESEFLAEFGKYKLVIAGEKGWKNESIFREIRNSQFKKDIHVINFVEDEDKEYLYNLASLFIYPSFFEGFGFPPLEAMKCGLPVIISNNSSLPEIAGNAAILIDPRRPDEIFRAMKEVLTKKNLRETLIKRGLGRSEKFDWKNTARRTFQVLMRP